MRPVGDSLFGIVQHRGGVPGEGGTTVPGLSQTVAFYLPFPSCHMHFSMVDGPYSILIL